MKRLLILAALGLFLAAHGAVGIMSVYQSASPLKRLSMAEKQNVAKCHKRATTVQSAGLVIPVAR